MLANLGISYITNTGNYLLVAYSTRATLHPALLRNAISLRLVKDIIRMAD